MSIELTYLVWSFVLFALYLGVQSALYRIDYGVEFAGGQRDNERAPNRWTLRGQRALSNFLETYPLFVALVVAIELSGRSEGLTQWGAHLWFWARLVYLPCYFIDVKFLRSGVWTVSIVGLVMMFAGVVA